MNNSNTHAYEQLLKWLYLVENATKSLTQIISEFISMFPKFLKDKSCIPLELQFSESHVRCCLLMRIRTMFDVFLYSSLFMPCGRTVKPLHSQHPQASFVVAPCHTVQVMLSFCRDSWQSSVCSHRNSLKGSRRHLAFMHHGGQTAAPCPLPDRKSHRPSKKNLQTRHDQLGTGLLMRNPINNASPSL